MIRPHFVSFSNDMWNFLYQLASPKSFYQVSDKIIKNLKLPMLALIITGFFWGLFIAPSDYQQGDAFRIMYVHVPSAFLSLSIYAAMGFMAILFLVWRIKLAGLMIRVCAEAGLLMTALALITGSIWGKPMWGTWWVWDARLTSELILLFLYFGILGTSRAYHHLERGDKAIAILTLAGLIDLPIIHYSVYWWNTLHQGATFSLFAKPKIASQMLYPLLCMLLGFSLYCIRVILQKARYELLIREKRQAWVKSLIGETSQ